MNAFAHIERVKLTWNNSGAPFIALDANLHGLDERFADWRCDEWGTWLNQQLGTLKAASRATPAALHRPSHGGRPDVPRYIMKSVRFTF